MQDCIDGGRPRNHRIGGDNKAYNSKMPLKYGFIDVEASPFDEPPVSSEIDLDQLVKALAAGSPLPKLTTTFLPPEDASMTSSLPHDESRYRSRAHARQEQLGGKKKQRKGKQKEKRISFADRLVDVVPEEIGVKTKSGSTKGSRAQRQSSRKKNMAEASVGTYEDESFISLENSLEYFLRGEWIQEDMDDILSPMTCKSSRDHRGSLSSEDPEGQICGMHGTCWALPDPADYSSKPFSSPFKWKEYTTLDSECLNVAFCRNESCANSEKNARPRVTDSVCSEEDQKDDETMSATRQAVASNLREILPPLESLQNILGRFFDGPNVGKDRSTKQKRRRKKRSDSDSLSMSASSALNGSDSEGSTLANQSLGLRVNVTAE